MSARRLGAKLHWALDMITQRTAGPQPARLLFALGIALAVGVLPGRSAADYVTDLKCDPALALHWRDIRKTGITDRANRLKEPYRVTRSQAEGSAIRILTLDPGDVLFGENCLNVALGNSSAQSALVSVHLRVEGGAAVVGPPNQQFRLAGRSPATNQGVASFRYRLRERRSPMRFSVRVVDRNGAELATASRGAIQPYYVRLYLDRCRVWEGDQKLGFRIKYQLAPELLRRARTTLVMSREGRTAWKQKLPAPTDRSLRGAINVSGLKPGDYELSARLRLGLRTVEISRQTIKLRAPEQIARK